MRGCSALDVYKRQLLNLAYETAIGAFSYPDDKQKTIEALAVLALSLLHISEHFRCFSGVSLSKPQFCLACI